MRRNYGLPFTLKQPFETLQVYERSVRAQAFLIGYLLQGRLVYPLPAVPPAAIPCIPVYGYNRGLN